MPPGQQMLFAPEKPLVKKLGQKFFKKIPKQPGVYKMRDAQGEIVYVGKAKNLRQRLQSYRTANPERFGRRHLRLLQAVTRIDFDLCPSEGAALKHEAKLIRELKPKFNRAGVWQGRPQFLVWRFTAQAVEWAVHETPTTGWERFGSLGGYAPRLRVALVRLLWLALNPRVGWQQMPHGWVIGRLGETVNLECGERLEEVKGVIGEAFWGQQELFANWLTRALNTPRPNFERAAILKDMEEIQAFFENQRRPDKPTKQMTLL